MNKALIKQRILLVISEYPEAVNDKALLYSEYWFQFDGWDAEENLYTNLLRVTRPSTIDRRLRELREAGLVKLSPKREKEVTEAFKSERDEHSRVFDNILGNPKQQLDKLTAISWLKDED